jgi:hypothetical protein
LPRDGAQEGVLSFYYSEDEAAVPIRAILLAKNNKSDPNIETGTYGLFSTCSLPTRAGIVRRGTGYMFFVTRRHRSRMLTGYYRLKWFTPGTLSGNDYAVAADHMHFVAPGIRLEDLPADLRAHCAKRFRLSHRVGSEHTRALLDLLESQPNKVQRYLEEIDRIERRNQHLTGFRYVAWRRTEPFTWDVAPQYLPDLEQTHQAPLAAVGRKNQSQSGWWSCTTCSKLTQSEALLKICPRCSQRGTLVEYLES